MTDILKLAQVSKTYTSGNVRALDNVSLDVGTGVFGLLGPNGAGKSTLMRTIATLQKPDSGTIHVGGIDAIAAPHQARTVIGFLPQDFGVYPNVSAEDLLDYFARLKGLASRGERRGAIEQLLVRTNLWEARGRAVSEYSGGMLKRFGVAQALLGTPKLIMVDEPTAGLDPEERARLLELLVDVGESAAVLLSTHIVEDVSDVCSGMAIINKGRVIFSGTPGQAVEEVRDHVWAMSVNRDETVRIARSTEMICQRLSGGKHRIFVYATAKPDDRFEPVAASLEHVYFHRLQAGNEFAPTNRGARNTVASAPGAPQ